MGSIFFKAFMGALAGLAAWAITEPFAPGTGTPAWAYFEYRLMITTGVMLGATLGGISAWMQGSRLHLFRGILLGALLGGFGALAGYQLGGTIEQMMFGTAPIGRSQNVMATIIARIVALTPIGAVLGFAIGLSTLNWRRGIQGAIGGTFGGFLGGALFDILGGILATMVIVSQGTRPDQFAEVGQLPRALLCLLLGMFIGLFIGIIERLARVAWIRLVMGRNEGKEWAIDTPHFVIGRSETANLPLFGDQAVAPMHASIVKQQGNYYLIDGGNPVGTLLNGHPVQQAPLFHGAQIQIAGFVLHFLMKVGSAPQQAAEALRAQQAYAYPAGVPAPAPQAYAPMAQPYVPPAPMASTPTVMTPYPGPSSQPTTAMPAQGPSLVAVSGPLMGQRFVVGGVVEAGRESPGIPLGFDTAASRRHAAFTPSGAGVMMTDLGSTNGTFVNDQRVASAMLQRGDTVRIGVTTLRVE